MYPPAVTGDALALRATVRAGQTFLTWRELPPAPEQGCWVRYRVHRALRPFTTSQDLSASRVVAEVGPHAGLNLMASIDRMALSQTPAEATYTAPRWVMFTIDERDGPLPPGTGLFVTTAHAAETAYYAVTAVVDGVERRTVMPGDTATVDAVEERVEAPAPVRQNDGIDYVHWTDSAGTPLYPAMSSVPGVPYNFRVHLPAGDRPPGGAPVIGLLHGAFHQFDTPDSSRGEKLDAPDRMDAIRVALDAPLLRGRIQGLEAAVAAYPPGGWYGYNRHYGTNKPLEEGTIEEYHVRRVLWTLDWIVRAHGGDPDRLTLAGGSMGGAGVLVIGLLHPDRFAALHAHIPLLSSGGPRWRRSAPAGSRPRLAETLPFEPAEYIAAHPELELPFIMCTAGRTDHIVGWPDKLALARAARETRTGFVLYWDVRGHGSSKEFPATWGRLDEQGRATHRLTSFNRKHSYPALADVTADDDPGTVDLAVHPSERPPLDAPGVGDLVGTINGSVEWDRATIEDAPTSYDITLRLLPYACAETAIATVTPRRLQAFRPAPGATVVARVVALDTGQALLETQVAADSRGRVTVTRVSITCAGTRLSLTLAGSHWGTVDT
jgi:hypothetical protein